jgi:acyl carrier protein
VIQQDIRRVLELHGRIASGVASLRDNDNLFNAGLTSLASVDVLMALEDTFEITFPDHMMQRKTFESIAAIAAAVESLKAEA